MYVGVNSRPSRFGERTPPSGGGGRGITNPLIYFGESNRVAVRGAEPCASLPQKKEPAVDVIVAVKLLGKFYAKSPLPAGRGKGQDQPLPSHPFLYLFITLFFAAEKLSSSSRSLSPGVPLPELIHGILN